MVLNFNLVGTCILTTKAGLDAGMASSHTGSAVSLHSGKFMLFRCFQFVLFSCWKLQQHLQPACELKYLPQSYSNTDVESQDVEKSLPAIQMWSHFQYVFIQYLHSFT